MKALFIILSTLISQVIFGIGSIEYCTGSQLKYKGGGSGGTGGHAFLYIEGLCKDYRFDFPRVIPCSQIPIEVLAKYPHSGVGISLDSEFKNVSWVATPTRELTFSGGSVENLVEQSLKYRVFEGVELHENKSQLNKKLFSKVLNHFNVDHKTTRRGKIPLNQPLLRHSAHSYEVFSSLYAIGTDIGISNARDLACIKLELKDQNQLRDITGFLNRTNGLYSPKEKSFVWHMLMSNCTHLALNTIHHAGLNTHLYKIEPFVRNPNISEYAKALLEDAKKTIKNMQTPADGFTNLVKQFPNAPTSYLPASKQLDNVFNTNNLKAFSFKPLKCNHYFNNELHKLRTTHPRWMNRNILYNNFFYKKYSQHFFSIKTLRNN